MRNDERSTGRGGSRLVPLSQVEDFEVAPGDPDVHGWAVVTSDGRTVGEVDELLVDAEAGMIRYLDVELDADLLLEELDRHVLIPIGYARMAEHEDLILLQGLESAQVVALPGYRHGATDRDAEVALLRLFDPGFEPKPDEDFYDLDAFDEDAFYGARRSDEARSGPPRSEADDRKVNEDRGVHPTEERLRAEREEEATLPTRGRY